MANIVTAPPKDRADLARPEATRGGVYFTPRVDIFEADKELTLTAEVPGVPAGRRGASATKRASCSVAGARPAQGREGSDAAVAGVRTRATSIGAFTIHESIDAGTRYPRNARTACCSSTCNAKLWSAVKPRRISVQGG